MKKTLKRLCTGFLALATIVTALPITAVHAEDNILNETGKLDYSLLKPVLFEMPTYQYLLTGDVIGQCLKLEK